MLITTRQQAAAAPTAGGALPAGAVRVSRKVRAAPAEVWEALSEPAVVAQWFGELSRAPRAGSRARLDFGDGDFFLLKFHEVEAPHLLRYSWRFLGTGPLDTITWRVAPSGDSSSVVSVTDTEPERTAEGARELREGWLDFTLRLREFLNSGARGGRRRPTRYDWRREFDGSVELPCRSGEAWERLFRTPSQRRWLPLEGDRLAEGARLSLADGGEPSSLVVGNVVWDEPHGAQFQLSDSGWRSPTFCHLSLQPRSHDTLLRVSHRGWEAIGPDDHNARRQRRRLGAAWVATLRRARRLLSRPN